MRSTLSAVRLAFCFAPMLMGQSGPDPESTGATYQPLTNDGRLRWFAWSTIGPLGDIGGIVISGWGTLWNAPHEYGTHWAGFGKRYGMRLTGISVSNAAEAGLGALWGEDPRYFRTNEAPIKSRIGHIIKMTFLATGRDGRPVPAYARYIAIPGNNFLSDTWRAPSDATLGSAGLRTGLGFLGRMARNTFEEFWPDIQHRLLKKHSEPPAN